MLVTAGYGKIAYANPQARQWFDLNGGDPDLELMAEAVHPADTFRDLFAMEGRASFRIGSRRVEAASHRLPGDARQMVVVLRDLAAARSEAGPEASRALVALSEIGLAISRNASFEETLSAILTSLSRAITCDAASIVTPERAGWQPAPDCLARKRHAPQRHAHRRRDGRPRRQLWRLGAHLSPAAAGLRMGWPGWT